MEPVELATLGWVDWFNNADCSDPSEASRQPKPNRTTMRSVTRSIWSRKVKQMVSGETGTVQWSRVQNIREPFSAHRCDKTPSSAGYQGVVERKFHPIQYYSQFTVARQEFLIHHSKPIY
jgi:hypothetical protein